MAEAKLIRIDKNGTKYYEGRIPCDRCGGHGGAEVWKFTGWTCYKCNGSGKIHSTWKEYTPEYEAKLNANRLKRIEKKRQEEIELAKANSNKLMSEFFEKNGFNKEGTTWIVLGDTYRIKDELKSKGAKFNSLLGWHFDHMESGYPIVAVDVEEVAFRNDFYRWNYKNNASEIVERIRKTVNNVVSKSEYIGEIGQKIKNKEVKLISVNSYERTKYSGYGFEDVYIYSFEDSDENIIVCKTTAFNRDLIEGEGKKFNIDFEIKDHSDYKDKKQTIVKRVKFEAI